MMKKLPQRVSAITAMKDPTVLIGMDVMFDDHAILWFDTIKERRMSIERIIDASPTHFVFVRAVEDGGDEYTFVSMTLAVYNEKVKLNIMVPQEFTDEEAMLTAFEKTREAAW